MASRRSPFAFVALFVVPFGLSAGAAYTVRSGSSGEPVVATQTIDSTVDTAAPTETTAPLTLETAATVVETTVAPVSETEAPTTKPPTSNLPEAPITSEGALLRKLDDQERRLFDAATGCDSLGPASSVVRDCETAPSSGNEVGWVSMDDGVDVIVRSADDGPDVWTVVLRANAASSRPPLLVDVTGDGELDLLVGWRSSDRVLGVDVVEFASGSADVTLHLSLIDGRVSAGDGSLEAFTQIADASYVRWRYTGGVGKWTAKTKAVTDPPGGQL